jgi:hypothetical protein
MTIFANQGDPLKILKIVFAEKRFKPSYEKARGVHLNHLQVLGDKS